MEVAWLLSTLSVSVKDTLSSTQESTSIRHSSEEPDFVDDDVNDDADDDADDDVDADGNDVDDNADDAELSDQLDGTDDGMLSEYEELMFAWGVFSPGCFPNVSLCWPLAFAAVLSRFWLSFFKRVPDGMASFRLRMNNIETP